ncbi:MAG: NADH-quinone oxidoreductase subunit A [Dehalococcoidales bacterium]|nr:NADH-quinone oxidoreductase subunit A [Dehalococcoidales bacterium]
MLTNYGYIALFLIIAIAFTLLLVLIPVILRDLKIVPRKPNKVKEEPFECGMPTIGKTWVQFNFRYYYYALVFLALDVMVVFIYPWAVELRNLGGPAFYMMLIFIGLIVIGYIYAWKKKALEWK